jgi:hypothetical protein
MRTQRDATLEMPTLILPAVPINIRAGEPPPKRGQRCGLRQNFNQRAVSRCCLVCETKKPPSMTSRAVEASLLYETLLQEKQETCPFGLSPLQRH